MPDLDYRLAAETVRGHLANSLQVLQAVLQDIRDREGEPFVLGLQDDLAGIRVHLTRALEILDAR